MPDSKTGLDPFAHVAMFAGDLRALYEELDRRLDAVLVAHPGSYCRECGACCTFPEGAQVLYGTTIEHAYLATALPLVRRPSPEGMCPCFERGTNFCTARERRPVVCRTHFCDNAMPDRAAREAVQDLYEWAQGELRRISDEHCLARDFTSVTGGRRAAITGAARPGPRRR